jgi:ankyrin repeat protein
LRLLLSKNPELEIKDKAGYTPLHLAAVQQQDLEEVVRLLLDRGAEIEAIDGEHGRTTLQWAVRNGHVKTVKLLLKRKPVLEGRDSYGNTALHIAAQHGQEKVVQLLLDNGADSEAIDGVDGRTALHWAVRKENFKTVGVLLEQNPDLDSKDKFGYTALHLAIRTENVGIVQSLLERCSKPESRDAKPETRDKYGNTALHLAAQQPKDLEMITGLLLKNGADIEAIDGSDGRTATHVAVRNGNIKVVQLLLGRKPSLEKQDKYGYTPLHLAARQSQDLEAIVLLLINNGADIEATDEKGGRTALQWAVRNGNTKIVKLLLERKPNLERKDKVNEDTALHIAARQPQDLEPIVRLLLAKGAKTAATSGDGGCTALHLAVRYGNVKVVRLLLAKNANIEAEMKKGQTTPLHLAATSGDELIIEALLEKKAKLNAKDGDGNTALHLAAQQPQDLETAVKILLEDSDIETTNGINDRTTLHLAVRNGNVKVTKLLLEEAKPKLERKDKHGFTALHLAARGSRNSDAITQLLLKYDAKIDATDGENNRTALHLAVRNGNFNAVQLLLKKKADVEKRDKLGFTALHLAARLPQYPETIAQLLLDNGAGIETTDKEGCTALHLAVQNRNVKVGRILLQKKANINSKLKKKTTALHLAATLGDELMVRALLEKDPKLEVQDENGCTALHRAVQQPQDLVTIVQLLLDKGANIEATGGINSRTALHLAVQNRNVRVTQLLLEKKPKLAKVDKDGYTALHLATQQSQDLIIQSLLDKGADIKATTGREGRTALHLAILNGNTKAVQLLLDRKSDLEEKDKYGHTALLLAAQHSQDLEAIAQLLLEKGANIEATNGDEGRTALHLAAQHGHEQMVKLLLQKRADITAKDTSGHTALELTPESNSAVQTLLKNPGQARPALHQTAPEIVEPIPFQNSGGVIPSTGGELHVSLGSATQRPASAASRASYLVSEGLGDGRFSERERRVSDPPEYLGSSTDQMPVMTTEVCCFQTPEISLYLLFNCRIAGNARKLGFIAVVGTFPQLHS